MRPSLPLLLLILLPPAFGPALSVAASVEARGADGRVQVSQAPALRLGSDGLGERIERQYRAGYYYALAQLALQQGQLADAEALLRRAHDADPGSLLLQRERGQVLEALGRDAQAAVLLERSLRAEPDDLELRRRLARAYTRLNKPELARALFMDADGKEPKDPGRLRSLVGLDLQVEDLVAAERRLRALLQSGGDADDEELLAVLLQRLRRHDEAALAYRRVLKADPGRSTAWARLSASLDAAGDTTAALRVLDEGLEAVPDSALLADQLGKLSYRLELFERSEAAFGRLVQADPADSDSLLYRGLSRLKLGRYAEAEADFETLGRLRDDSPGQWYGLALALSLQKKYPQAEAALNRVLDLNPKAEPAWVQLAFLHERQGRLAEAEQALKRGLRALPASEDLTLLLAAAHDSQGEKAEAVAVLRQAVRRGAGEAVRFQLAVSLDKAGDFQQAEGVLEALIKDAPGHAQALNYLGYSWAERGRRLAEAEALIRRALELDPDNHYYLDSLGWALHRQARHVEAERELSKAAAAVQAGTTDAEEAVVLDHLAEAREALGQAAGAAEARARARAIRAAARPAAGAPAPADAATNTDTGRSKP